MSALTRPRDRSHALALGRAGRPRALVLAGVSVGRVLEACMAVADLTLFSVGGKGQKDL